MLIYTTEKIKKIHLGKENFKKKNQKMKWVDISK